MDNNATGFKKQFSRENFDYFDAALKYADSFIRGITLEDDTLILSSKNKTGFLGYPVAIQSTQGLFKELCLVPDQVLNPRVELEIIENPRVTAASEAQPVLDQLMMYRLSQDHLEMYFGKIRSRCGCNDNPNAVQLKAAVKRLAKNNDVAPPETGNCTVFNNTTSLSVDITIPAADPSESISTDMIPIEDCGSLCWGPEWDAFILDELTNAALMIIATRVQRKLLCSCNCASCNDDQSGAHAKAILGIGQVCQFLFKRFVAEDTDVDVESYHGYLTTRALNCVMEDFQNLLNGVWDCMGEHKASFISKIIDHFHDELFLQYTKHIVPYKETVRPKLTKLIHFSGN